MPPTALGDKKFEGTVSAPLFPNVYVAYKMGSLAFSGGFMPIGGGGSADYADGLPSFETRVAPLAVAPALVAIGVNAYDLDMAFEGSSIYMGGQASVSYKLNDMISVAVGGRFVSASNTYTGHLTDIQINPGGVMQSAPTFFTGAAGQYTAGATAAYAAAALFTSYGMLDSAAYYTAVGDAATASAAEMTYLAAQTADLELEDATKKGTGFTAIISANISPMDGLNIGVRYETLTQLELETESDVDIPDVIEDGAKENYDMPAMLAVGASYKIMPALRAEASFNYYMNTGVGWDGTTRNVDNLENGFEGGVACEYKLSDALVASAGFLYSQGGAKDEYQTDLDFSLGSSTIGFGVGYSLSDNLGLNAGFANTFYTEGENAAGTETYNKTSIDIAVGVNYSF
jgi:long-subunit fatty acid transport protein